jgi:hypothetical protein
MLIPPNDCEGFLFKLKKFGVVGGLTTLPLLAVSSVLLFAYTPNKFVLLLFVCV